MKKELFDTMDEEDYFDSRYPEFLKRFLPITDKTQEIRTFMHYTDPDVGKQTTVFGQAKPGLFYNYSDRLFGDKWTEGVKIAVKKGKKYKTAEFFEEVLKHFHDATFLDLQHIVLDVNRSNGYHYLVFGYNYE